DMELAVLAAGVGRGQDAHEVGSADTFTDQAQPVRAVERVHERLGADRALLRLDMGHSRADREELGGDGDGDAAAALLVEDDRPGHAAMSSCSSGPRASGSLKLMSEPEARGP